MKYTVKPYSKLPNSSNTIELHAETLDTTPLYTNKETVDYEMVSSGEISVGIVGGHRNHYY